VLRNGAALRLYYFLSFAAIGVFFPFFPTWLDARGVTGLGLGAILALRPVMGMVGPIAFGFVADALGLRGSLVRLACLGSLVCFAVLAGAGQVGTTLGYWPLFAVVALFSLFRAPMLVLADVVALEEASSYGRQRLWGSLGFMVTVFVAGTLLDLRALAPFPTAVTALLLTALLASLGLPRKSDHPPRPVLHDARRLAASGDFGLLLLVALLWTASHSGYDAVVSLHLRDLGGSSTFVGLCWAVGSLAEVGLMAVSGSLLDRYGAPRLLVFGTAVGAVRWLLLGTVRSLPVLLLLQPLHAFSYALVWIAALAVVKQRAPAHVMATAQGLVNAALAVGAGLGTLGAGPLYAARGGGAVFLAAAAVAAVACAAAVRLAAARSASAGDLVAP